MHIAGRIKQMGEAPFKGGYSPRKDGAGEKALREGVKTMAEKRDTKRHRRRLSLRFGIERAERVGFTEDISRNGLFIRTASPHPPNTRLNIEITTSDGGIIRIEGKVRWIRKVPLNLIHLVNKCGMGVMITGIKEGKERYNVLFHERSGEANDR